MTRIPVLRWGEPYESLETDKVVHFVRRFYRVSDLPVDDRIDIHHYVVAADDSLSPIETGVPAI